MKKRATVPLTISALCLAGGVILPQAFHFLPIPNAGIILCPMHIPVLLCGILCGWPWGLLCGILTPLLSSMITGMPALFPTGASMICELAAYGILSGIFYQITQGKIYATLFLAMLGGRFVMGISSLLFYNLAGKGYTFELFLTSAFVTALPGILLQLTLIPLLIVILKKSKLFPAQQHS